MEPSDNTNADVATAPAGEATPAEGDGSGGVMDLLKDVDVEITLEIGRRKMRIADVMRLGPGQMVELDKQAGEPLELLVNGRVIGRGEAVVVGDRYAIRITEILGPDGRKS